MIVIGVVAEWSIALVLIYTWLNISIGETMFICQFCDRELRNPGAKATHVPFCKLNPCRTQRPKSPDAHKKKGTPAWNKGLVGDARCAHSEETKKKFLGNPGKGKTSEVEAERIRKITESAEIKNGGLRHGSGRGKKGWYCSIFCDSSWELAYLLWAKDHNKSVSRNVGVRYYEFQGRIRKYIPDFIVDGNLVEIKGYKTEQWDAKISANPDIFVLYKEEMRPILDYVVNKYGKNFIELYERGVDTLEVKRL